jgi:type VI secretion system protein VasI
MDRTALAAISAAFLCSATAAQSQEACTKIEAPAKRLQCYDNWSRTALGAIILNDNIPAEWLATTPPEADASADPELADEIATADTASEEIAAVVTEEPAAPDEGAWNVEVNTSAMTDTTDVFASLNSENSQICRSYGSSSYLTLWVRCLENTTAVIFSGDCHMASGFQGYGDVTYRLDDDKAVTKGFQESTDNLALGLWSGGSAIPFAKSILGKDRMIVRFTPFGMSPVEYTFDLKGSDAAIQQVREQCSW